MKKVIFMCIMFTGMLFCQDMIVRVYTQSWQDLEVLSPKHEFDIAGARGGEWYDIVADQKLLDRIITSGLTYEVVVHSITALKDEVRAGYLSYAQITDSLQQMVANYPLICKFDSLPIPTYEGRWIYGIKISDNPDTEEADEPGFLIDGQHHAREWACHVTVLFFVDSILSSYGVVSEITDIINTTEIYCFPVINVDGYVYDYPSQYSWRKNREPFGGSIGTDPNRNYAGCSPDIEGDWGAVDDGQASHWPSYTLFCGAYANSGDETRALTLYAKSHTINAYMTYHSYAEKLCWPWGWTSQPCPDSALHSQVGNTMADMIERLSGGTYGRGPISTAIYPVSGSSLDWFYSWCHWVEGISNLSYTIELGTTFYQPVSDLDHMVRENFDALLYLADFCDSIVILGEGVVPSPEIYPLDTVGVDFTLYWHAKNTDDNHPTQWELVELSNPSIIEDDLESGTGRWILDGFTLSTTRAHSGTHSFFSGNTHDMNHAVRTNHPYLVQSGDSVTFWCWYNLENDYDVAVVEASENTKYWFNLDTMRFTGNQSSWVRKAFSLEDWVGKSVYIRFRSMTDSYVLEDGFYVDDIAPACLFSNVDTISSSIADTFYQFTGHTEGDYYYYVSGDNATWDWGDYSCLELVAVVPQGIPPSAPNIVQVEKSNNGLDVELTWNRVVTDTMGNPDTTDYYVIYRNTFSSFIPYASDSIGAVLHPETVYTDTGALIASESFYYLVKAVDAEMNKSKKSNMGYVLDRFFNYNTDRSSRNWVSLPWHSGYSTVSDLVADLSPAGDPLESVTNLRDDMVEETWLWDTDFMMWSGPNDFTIDPGRGYEMVAIKDTTLVLVGSNDPDGLISLNYNTDRSSRNWLSIPFNADYSTVDDIAQEYSPAGDPLESISNLRDDMVVETWLWDTDFMMWYGPNDFAIVPGRGYEFVPIKDTTWNPNEYSNEAFGQILARRGTKRSDIEVYEGQSLEPDRAPVWIVKKSDKRIDYSGAKNYTLVTRRSVEKADYCEPGISHIVRVHLDMKEFDNLVFTAYRPDQPYDVLTENMIGSCVAIKDDQAAFFFNVANFKRPWQNEEEVVLIIEALKRGKGYFTVVNVTLDERVDIQDVKDKITLTPISEPVFKKDLAHWYGIDNDNIIGYSLYRANNRLNNRVIEKAYSALGDVIVKPVIKGGYETVYGSHQGPQSTPDKQIPRSYAFNLFPNPFVTQTRIEYALPKQTLIEILIYDVSGRKVKTLVSEMQKPGYYKADWFGDDDIGRKISTGVYFIQMNTKEYKSHQKVVFVH